MRGRRFAQSLADDSNEYMAEDARGRNAAMVLSRKITPSLDSAGLTSIIDPKMAGESSHA
jgi:hypothetical protein